MMRTFWIGCVVALLLGAPTGVRGQSTADSYFHEGARQYVAGNQAAARRAVEQGLAIAPSDPRLVALRKKLQQSGQSGSRRDSSASSQNRSQQNENQSSDSASKDGEKSSQSEEQRAPRAGPNSQSRGSSSRSGRRSSSQRADRQGGGTRSGRSGTAAVRADSMRRGGTGQPIDTLSRAQAERLLRALEGQERQLLRQLRTRSTERRRVEKDW